MFSRRPVLYVVAVLAVAFLSATPSHATIVTYADFASWSAAVSGVTTVTIPEPLHPSDDYFGSGTASVTYSSVVFSTSAALSDGNFFNIASGFSSGNPAPVLSSQSQTTGVANILISLPGNVMGFALHYGTFNGSDVTFTLSNGDTVTRGSTASAYNAPDFLGLTDNTPFGSVLATSPDSGLNLNNVSFGSTGVTGVPEPAAWLLLTTGLAGLLGYGRRRARSA